MVGSSYLEEFLHLAQSGNLGGEIASISKVVVDLRPLLINNLDVDVLGRNLLFLQSTI